MNSIVRLMILALLLVCFMCAAAAEEAALVIVTDRTTDLSQGPGNNFPKSGVFARETFEYTGICVADESGRLWHKAIRGEWEMWIAADDATVMYNGMAMPEEHIVRTTATVNLRLGPGSEYELAAVAEPGMQLVCIGEYRPHTDGCTWYMVSTENGAAWLSSRYAVPVNDIE